MTINDDALILLRSLVLHVATGCPLTDAERQAVQTMAVLLGASVDGPPPPLLLDAVDAVGSAIDCNAEGEFDLAQIGTCLWLAAYLMRLGGDADKPRRRVARTLIDYFETRKSALGLDPDQPILYQYLKQAPILGEGASYLRSSWLPEPFLLTSPDIDGLALDRLFTSPRSRLTLYKICYWFAVTGRRRHAAVIGGLQHIRSELQLNNDDRCLGISAAITAKTGSAPTFQDPARNRPVALVLARRVVAGTIDAEAPGLGGIDDVPAERLVAMIPPRERVPALAVIFDIAMRETRLSPAALVGIARLVEAIDPSEGDLTGLLMRHELDSGRRIRLPRAYTINYSDQRIVKFRGSSRLR